MNLYQEHIIDHYRNPRNRKSLANPDFSSAAHNPSCGDSIKVEFSIKGSLISTAGFSGHGCVISQAAASMLTQFCIEKPIHTIKKFNQETMRNLLGIDLGPTRLKCALLVLEATQDALPEIATERSSQCLIEPSF